MKFPIFLKIMCFYHNFEIHVSNQMNQKYKIWPALLVFHFLWVHQVSPKNILLSIIKVRNALSKPSPLSLLSHAGVKLLINSLKDLIFDSLKTKLSPVLPKLILKANLCQNIYHTAKSPCNTKYIHNPIFLFVMFSSYYNY